MTRPWCKIIKGWSTRHKSRTDLILVGHSSGGRATTGAAEGLDATSRRRQGKKGGVSVLFFRGVCGQKGGEDV